ncbi:MAG: hypothetical protein WB998_09540, partial [Solirubrobacteraceae bacterium]
MSLWVLLAAMGLFKLVVATLMLWVPFHADSAMVSLAEDDGGGEDEGGTKTVPGSPREPHPRRPLT